MEKSKVESTACNNKGISPKKNTNPPTPIARNKGLILNSDLPNLKIMFLNFFNSGMSSEISVSP